MSTDTTNDTNDTTPICIGADHTAKQIIDWVADGRVELDTAIDHFCSTRYATDDLDTLADLDLDAYRVVMKAQSKLQTQAAVAVVKASKGGRKSTECPLTVDEFLTHAGPMTLTLEDTNGNKLVLKASSQAYLGGSLGWNFSSRPKFKINAKATELQFGCNVTVIGSKTMRVSDGYVPMMKDRKGNIVPVPTKGNDDE